MTGNMRRWVAEIFPRRPIDVTGGSHSVDGESERRAVNALSLRVLGHYSASKEVSHHKLTILVCEFHDEAGGA